MRALALLFALMLLAAGPARAGDRDGETDATRAAQWAAADWAETDFANRAVPLKEIVSAGPGKDDIPPIDAPMFEDVEAAADRLDPEEPVLSVVVNGAARAYPLSVLIWHEIANDVVGGAPVAATYCPLCNSAIVYDRRVDGRTLDFGTTGKLRKSDLVMWDRQTESWWQQFTGRAIVGAMTGARLKVIPSRIESFARFRNRRPDGMVLRPNHPQLRAYGRNPYVRYDSAPWPFLYRGQAPDGIAPLARVVAVGDAAWSLDLLRRRGRIKAAGGVMLSWTPGQASALDAPDIADGRDVGNVVVERMGAHGPEDVAHLITFAFAFHGFRPEGTIHVACQGGAKPPKPLACG